MGQELKNIVQNQTEMLKRVQHDERAVGSAAGLKIIDNNSKGSYNAFIMGWFGRKESVGTKARNLISLRGQRVEGGRAVTARQERPNADGTYDNIGAMTDFRGRTRVSRYRTDGNGNEVSEQVVYYVPRGLCALWPFGRRKTREARKILDTLTEVNR